MGGGLITSQGIPGSEVRRLVWHHTASECQGSEFRLSSRGRSYHICRKMALACSPAAPAGSPFRMCLLDAINSRFSPSLWAVLKVGPSQHCPGLASTTRNELPHLPVGLMDQKSPWSPCSCRARPSRNQSGSFCPSLLSGQDLGVPLRIDCS